MAQADLFLMFLKPLNRMNARYMGIKASATVNYGMPRMTNDIDVVVTLPKMMAGFAQNRRQVLTGMGGRFGPEYTNKWL